MGLFFDDDKGDKTSQQERKSPQQGFFTVAGLMILGFFLSMLAWICKPAFTWMFTFEGRTRDQRITQLIVIAIVFGGSAFLLYRIPGVRDILSLSTTHTVNLLGSDGRILFPDRSFFVPEGNKRSLRGSEIGNTTYVTYTGYNERVAEKMHPSFCQLVPRGEKILLSSETPPVRAEGFEDEVKYVTITNGTKVTGMSYVKFIILHPKTLIDDTELEKYEFADKKEEPWQNFLSDWEYVQKISNSPSRWFELKALPSEHAIVCF